MRRRKITLALQGGGSHGAFTWGVLDRLLEEERIEIEGISGASAGAMNAVMLAYGDAIGGREGARRMLADFWERVALKAPFRILSDQAYIPASASSGAKLVSPIDAYLALARFFSPYQLNPFDINPLRDILASLVDFDRLRLDARIRLFIAATQVRSGRLKLFRNRQLSLDALLASACLPELHHPVEIGGEAYWDGGFTANPPIYPLLHRCRASDIVLVLLDFHPRSEVPSTAQQICSRLTEINFNSALHTELQGIALAKREAQRGLFSFGRLERKLRHLNMHMIEARDFMSRLNGRSKLNTYEPFIKALRDEGRRAAELWLENKSHHLGVRSSVSLLQFMR